MTRQSISQARTVRWALGAAYAVVLIAATVGQAQSKPSGPSGLKATPLDESVLLNWNHVEDEDVQFYRIYRSDTSGELGEMVRRLQPFFITGEMHGRPADGNLENGKTYYYTVQSEATDGTRGGFSEQLAVTPQQNTDVPVPDIKGKFWQIAPHSPSGYEWDNGETDNACDFAIWQAADGTW